MNGIGQCSGIFGGEANVEGGAKAFHVDPNGVALGRGSKQVNYVFEGSGLILLL